MHALSLTKFDKKKINFRGHANHGQFSWGLGRVGLNDFMPHQQSSRNGNCDPSWLGDGFCDSRCMHLNEDGGDCRGRDNVDTGTAIMAR